MFDLEYKCSECNRSNVLNMPLHSEDIKTEIVAEELGYRNRELILSISIEVVCEKCDSVEDIFLGKSFIIDK